MDTIPYFHQSKIEFSWHPEMPAPGKIKGQLNCTATLYLLATEQDSHQKGNKHHVTDFFAIWVLDDHNEWSIKKADALPGPRGWPVPTAGSHGTRLPAGG